MMRNVLSASTVLAALLLFTPTADAGWGCGHRASSNACCGTSTYASGYGGYQNYGGQTSYGGCCGNAGTVYSHGTSSANYYPSSNYPSSTYNSTSSGSCCGGSSAASTGYSSGYRGVQTGTTFNGGYTVRNNGFYGQGYNSYHHGYGNGFNRPGYVDGPGYQAQRFSNRYMGVGSGW